ncbi:hypothetical protein LZ32DRAFT_47882 [Colletotrichum eremochloae]|nr:hypothetical protein LZ32DRAFT_47882 [Colletotrichum eremochloae]
MYFAIARGSRRPSAFARPSRGRRSVSSPCALLCRPPVVPTVRQSIHVSFIQGSIPGHDRSIVVSLRRLAGAIIQISTNSLPGQPCVALRTFPVLSNSTNQPPDLFQTHHGYR